ncbi:MAG TPA: polysaccharide deacetylase family protein [Vicinamibacterales bacterium]
MATNLMYHDIVAAGSEDTSGFPGRDAARYKVTPERFATHLDAVLDAAGSSGGALPLMITFDDGGVSATLAADLLEARGLRGWFFITADYIGRPGFVDKDALRDLHTRGHVVGSHSCSHPLRMARCSDNQLREEWTRSRSELAGILGVDVTAASVPGGDYSTRVALAAGAAGLTHLFTSEPSCTVARVGPVAVHGRFVVRAGTSSRTIAALAAGARWPAARQRVAWNLRKAVKRTAGSAYLEVRRMLLRHGHEVAWGDIKD